MADLTTTPNGIWILQALLGVEKMPTALRLRPFIPSVDGDGTVATEIGDVPWSQTAEYQTHVAAGVIDRDGRVDDAVRDWMAVVGRPQREVLVVIRRPKPLDGPVPDDEDVPALIEERVMSICQRDRWLAMIARSGEEVVLAPLGEAARGDEQIDLICDTVLHAFSHGQAAQISGFNVPSATFESTLKENVPKGRPVMAAALARLGLSPDQVAVLSAACHLDESAMGVVSVIDHGIEKHFHPDVISVIDSEHGRITISHTTGPDGTRWTSVWPTTPDALRADLAKFLNSAKAPAAPAAR
ncbi:ESX secretion-associated protein EspG [Mycolicibacterium sp. 120270]|uniref:ESX secretion-associated protein EspG n=1 Tax=Mycolicibacterium sp. 120270 TaxID=3090600 RepID=UPI00299CFF1F|nr:ESX secretion-associated protein EspG [Mycolicibacterium sp. 120270]MDX1885208.1 ESX secretion-associated protein EspG [Mycolicibacterium sp. 120270]